MLHGTLPPYQDIVQFNEDSPKVQRIQYDSGLNGRLLVEGREGNDSFFSDDVTVITTLDGGAGNDSFQVGQIFGQNRTTEANMLLNDIFPELVATTRGWLSPGLRETADTVDILQRAGVDYVCDWVVDDRPSWMHTTGKPMISMPYNLEINDSIIYAIERHATGEMARRLEFTLRRFEKECRDSAIVLAIGLHPHLISVPHRIHEPIRVGLNIVIQHNKKFTPCPDCRILDGPTGARRGLKNVREFTPWQFGRVLHYGLNLLLVPRANHILDRKASRNFGFHEFL